MQIRHKIAPPMIEPSAVKSVHGRSVAGRVAGTTAACDVQLGTGCAAMFNMLGRWPLAAWLACSASGWAWINLVHIWSISAGFCVLWSPLI